MHMAFVTKSNDMDKDQAAPSTSTPRREMKKPRPNPNPNPNPNSEPSGSKGMEFFFVDESSSTKGKRSHVMKHHIREKKKERGPAVSAPLSRDSSTQPGQSTRMVFWKQEEEDDRGGEKLKTKEKEKEEEAGEGTERVLSRDEPAASRSPGKGTGKNLDKGDIASATYEDAQLRSQTSRSLIRKILPKSMAVDPFDTLPITLTPDMEQLLIVWGYKMSYWSGQNLCIKSSTFKLAMANPSAFYAVILSYTARFRDRVECPKAEPRAGPYVRTAERLLAEELQKPDRDEDQIILSLASLSLQEERYGCGTKAVRLMEDAMSRLKSRIGNSVAETYLHYIRLTQPPRLTTCAPTEATRLISFLRDVETLSTGPLPALSQIPEFKDAFQFGSPLHFMLSAGPSPTPVPKDERKWVILHDSREPCRIAALVYIAAALLDNFNSPENSSRLISWIVAKIQDNRLDRFPSTESLMWLLLSEPYDSNLRNPWRPWFVGHLMEVVFKLPISLRFHFSEIVLRILMARSMDLEVSIEKFEAEVGRFIDPEKETSLVVLPWRGS